MFLLKDDEEKKYITYHIFLDRACIGGHADTVQLLLERGADSTKKDEVIILSRMHFQNFRESSKIPLALKFF